jgi:hypothetical protein
LELPSEVFVSSENRLLALELPKLDFSGKFLAVLTVPLIFFRPLLRLLSRFDSPCEGDFVLLWMLWCDTIVRCIPAAIADDSSTLRTLPLLEDRDDGLFCGI